MKRSTLFCMLLLFSARPPRRWQNSNSGGGVKIYEDRMLSLASDTEAYTGHLDRARVLTRRAVESALRMRKKKEGSVYGAVCLAFAAKKHKKRFTATSRKLGRQ